MVVQDSCVESDILLVCERIELPANGIDRLGDFLRRTGSCSFKEQMFDEMGDSGASVTFEARTALYPDADGYRSEMQHDLGSHHKAVPHLLPLYIHSRPHWFASAICAAALMELLLS